MKKIFLLIIMLLWLLDVGLGQERMPLFLQDQTVHIVGESVSQFVTRENLDALAAKTCKNPHRKAAKESCAVWADAAAGQPRTFATDEYSKIEFIGGKLAKLESRPGKKFYLMNPEFDQMTKICILISTNPISCATSSVQLSAYQYVKSIARVKRLGGTLTGYSPAELQAAALVADAEKLESTPIRASKAGTPSTIESIDEADVRAKSAASTAVQKEGLATFKADSAAVDAAPDDATRMKRLTEMVEHAQSSEEANQHALEDLVDSITTQIDDSTSSYDPE